MEVVFDAWHERKKRKVLFHCCKEISCECLTGMNQRLELSRAPSIEMTIETSNIPFVREEK